MGKKKYRQSKGDRDLASVNSPGASDAFVQELGIRQVRVRSSKKSKRRGRQERPDLHSICADLSNTSSELNKTAKKLKKKNKKRGEDGERERVRAKLERALKQVQDSIRLLDGEDGQVDIEEAEAEPLAGAFLSGATSSLTSASLEAASTSLLEPRSSSRRTRMSKKSEKRICDLFRATVSLDSNINDDKNGSQATLGDDDSAMKAEEEKRAMVAEALPFKVLGKKELDAELWRQEERTQKHPKRSKKKAKKARIREARQRKNHEEAVRNASAPTNFVMRSPTLQL